MKGYTSKNDIERYMLTDIDESFNTQINEWIESVEDSIDEYTGRNFIADTEASVKYYDGDGTHELLIDDCVELEKIEMSGALMESEELDEDDYYVYPYNRTPKTRVYYDGIFVRDNKNIEVTAKWGYSESVPSDIKLAATIMVSLIIEEAHQSEGETDSESIGSYSVSYKKSDTNQNKVSRAKTILDRYRKINIK
jgi:hypothetical protein